MADMKDIVKIAVDAHRGNVEKYSVGQSQELLRKALIEANNGSTKLDFKAIRDGKCPGLFALVEELLKSTAVEDLVNDNMFMALVDFRNLAEGDKNEFVIKDSNLFMVGDTADGTQAVRRQRLTGSETVSIPTTLRTVRIYEELNRVLAGRVDFNDMISAVSASFRKELMDDVYVLWNGATADDLGGVDYFPVGGTYNEDELLDLISNVEMAADGKPATIVGTRKALRPLKDAIKGAEAESDLYNQGYVGKFYGTPVVAINQRRKNGTKNEPLYEDNMLTIIAGDQKPIKVVYEGDPLMLMGNPMDNMDLTQEYLYGEKYGMAIVMAGGNSGIGRYQVAEK